MAFRNILAAVFAVASVKAYLISDDVRHAEKAGFKIYGGQGNTDASTESAMQLSKRQISTPYKYRIPLVEGVEGEHRINALAQCYLIEGNRWWYSLDYDFAVYNCEKQYGRILNETGKEPPYPRRPSAESDAALQRAAATAARPPGVFQNVPKNKKSTDATKTTEDSKKKENSKGKKKTHKKKNVQENDLHQRADGYAEGNNEEMSHNERRAWWDPFDFFDDMTESESDYREREVIERSRKHAKSGSEKSSRLAKRVWWDPFNWFDDRQIMKRSYEHAEHDTDQVSHLSKRVWWDPFDWFDDNTESDSDAAEEIMIQNAIHPEKPWQGMADMAKTLALNEETSQDNSMRLTASTDEDYRVARLMIDKYHQSYDYAVEMLAWWYWEDKNAEAVAKDFNGMQSHGGKLKWLQLKLPLQFPSETTPDSAQSSDH